MRNNEFWAVLCKAQSFQMIYSQIIKGLFKKCIYLLPLASVIFDVNIRTVLLDNLMRTFEYDPFGKCMNEKRSAKKWLPLFCKHSITFFDKWSLHFDTKPCASYLTLPAKWFMPKKFAEPPLVKLLIDDVFDEIKSLLRQSIHWAYVWRWWVNECFAFIFKQIEYAYGPLQK